jgi:nucleolar protein 15
LFGHDHTLFIMSSTAIKKAKTVARTKTKRPLAEPDETPLPSLKGHKSRLTKGEEHTHKTKSKPVREEGTKRATSAEEETRQNTVLNSRNHTKRATFPERKLRGPWRAPSSSPSLSPTSDFEPPLSKEDESGVPQEEDSPDEENENVHLYGFSTDEDSSDDDLDVDDEAVDVGSLPTVARDDAAVKRKLERAKRNPVRVSFYYAPQVANMTHYYTRSLGV